MIRCLFYSLVLLPCLASADTDDLPSYVLKLPASVTTVLIAETGTATMHRYASNDSGLLVSGTQAISIGQNGAGKQVTGDRRTPLGIYFIVDELDTSNLHEKYGPVAFPLDYPNVWDKTKQRSGSGIWIHGVTPGSGPRPERDTDGCIALANDELLALEQHLVPLQTPVIVTRAIQRASREEIEETAQMLLEALESWESSYRDGNWHRFLSLYAQEFTYRSMSRDEWIRFRVGSVANRPIVDFAVDDIMLLADPEEAGLYLSRFRQTISESGRSIETIKRLYWRKSASGDFRVVAEDNG